eukprot:15461662-Alexandrium_andersonii.AAC.1
MLRRQWAELVPDLLPFMFGAVVMDDQLTVTLAIVHGALLLAHHSLRERPGTNERDAQLRIVARVRAACLNDGR